MPLYVYRFVRPGQPEATFEITQSIHADALTRHPETGEPIERVICVPTIGKGALGDAEIRNSGLTKLKRTSDGTYEKQV